jgi:peptide/nickel transport system permease protein
MSVYLIRRILYTFPILLGVCLIIFVIFNVTAGDPTLVLLGKHATQEHVQQLRSQLGLDRSLTLQYLDIVKSCFTMNFGRSWSTKQEISSMIVAGMRPSLSYTLPAFFLSIAMSIFLSLVVAYFRGRLIDRLSAVLVVAMMSISALAYILFFQWFLAYKLGWFEISGFESGFPDFIPYIILPTLIYIILSIGPNLRFFRTVILDEVYQDYVRTARSKGVGEIAVMIKHVFKNALIPIMTYVIIQIPFLILGGLLIESFFGIPGLGGMILAAINSNDFPVIKAMTILSAMAYILFSLITDILYMVVDPRVKLK